MKRTKSIPYVLFSFILFFIFSSYPSFASASMEKMEDDDQGFFYSPSMDYPVTFPKGHRWFRAKATEERVDLTGLSFMTIDPEGARDLDDALYVDQEEQGGYHIAIAIADPTYYVKPRSSIAKEACRRSFTFYGGGAPIPMLPPKLVRACSLEQDKKRPALIVDVFIDQNGNFQDVPTIYRALIRSQHRFSYETVNRIYEGEWFGVLDPDLKKRVSLVWKAAQALRSYYSMDSEILRSQEVVSEFMTTANNAAAIVLEKMVEDSTLKKAVFRAQDDMESRAFYSSKSSFHASFDLAYTHFTSPIRRYADMMVHWLLFHPGYTFSDTTLDYINQQQEGMKIFSSFITS